ncbi:MAG: hypothetical protein HN380_18125 [Victivallales bacterium]|nr:hypothetical protein [Victivallales bacterium]
MPRPTTNPYGERVLRFQTPALTGKDVWDLQIKLIGWGSGSDNDGIGVPMEPVRVTGTFDATTRDAVMRFQKAHDLPITGTVDGSVFRTVDHEAARHPILLHHLKCPCVHKENDGPIFCRCTEHSDDGKPGVCKGFGMKRFAGKFLLDGVKLADNTDISTEKLDLYDRQEYEGMDKAVLWALRALCHRAELKVIRINAGYRCWIDNYHHTDDTRWQHRRSTFHFGKAIEFHTLDPGCTKTGWDDAATHCPECEAIRLRAIAKCGFQLRWQEENRVSVAEVSKTARPPATPFSIHIDTVRRLEREADEFAKTDKDAEKPLYEGKLNTTLFPVDLGAGHDPKTAASQPFFLNTETGPGGWFPLGKSRLFHGGIHLYVGAGTKVRAIADGEIVGCRAGDAEEQPHGSRNFVLIKHKLLGKGTWENKEFYSLYMHLDGEKAGAQAKTRWRRELYLQSKRHVVASATCPKLVQKTFGTDKRLLCKEGLAPGDRAEVTGNAVAAKTLDDRAPANSEVVKLGGTAPAYIPTKWENKELSKIADAVAGLTAKLAKGAVVGLKEPIAVHAGELLGQVAKGATHDSLKAAGTFLHFETFAAASLPVGPLGFVAVSGPTDLKKAADRKEAVDALIKARVLPQPTDGVLLESELQSIIGKAPYGALLRSTTFRAASHWAVDWDAALKQAACFGFLKDTDRDALAKAFNTYSWWADVKKQQGAIPAPETIYYYHPITLILQIAYA